MTRHRQVEASHYRFAPYMSKERWSSVWHQLNEVQKLDPERVLEIGPGPGVLKSVAALFGIRVETLDLDPALGPDHVGSAESLPLEDASFDVVCAFQMLEHLPYETALEAFAEMVRVSRRHVVISLPDAKPVWRYQLQLPRVGLVEFLLPHPFWRAEDHVFDGEHYWEVNKRGYELRRVVDDLGRHIPLVSTFRVFTLPYHRFFVFSRGPDATIDAGRSRHV